MCCRGATLSSRTRATDSSDEDSSTEDNVEATSRRLTARLDDVVPPIGVPIGASSSRPSRRKSSLQPQQRGTDPSAEIKPSPLVDGDGIDASAAIASDSQVVASLLALSARKRR